MAISAQGIIFSSINNNTLTSLTSDRTIAAIPFACRYRFVDFCISNLVNADISRINIVANYNYRSLKDHLGSGKDWDLARRKNGINIISPFQMSTSAGAKMYSTHMEALKNMKQYVTEFKEDYVVLMDTDNIVNINIADVIKQHEKTDADITLVTHLMDADYTSKRQRMMLSSVAGKVTDIAMNTHYTEKNNELSLGIMVMSTEYLLRVIGEAEAYNLNSFTAYLLSNFKFSNFRTYRYIGYVASISSFYDYYKCSIELTKNEKARESLIFKPGSPIMTKVHNSAPVRYSKSASVKDSMIADDCIIEGTVTNSILFRGVKVEQGAVVKNSVLFGGTYVGKNASLNCIVTDKDVHISDGVNLSGNENHPFYVRKSRKI